MLDAAQANAKQDVEAELDAGEDAEDCRSTLHRTQDAVYDPDARRNVERTTKRQTLDRLDKTMAPYVLY